MLHLSLHKCFSLKRNKEPRPVYIYLKTPPQTGKITLDPFSNRFSHRSVLIFQERNTTRSVPFKVFGKGCPGVEFLLPAEATRWCRHRSLPVSTGKDGGFPEPGIGWRCIVGCGFGWEHFRENEHTSEGRKGVREKNVKVDDCERIVVGCCGWV